MEQLEQLANRQFGDFILHDLVGRRASMALYRATQQSLKRFVLFKIIELKSVPVPKDDLQEDFLAFTSRVVTLEFMNLQPIYDFGVINDEYIYIAARFMAGDLHELLKGGALPPEQALALTVQIIRAAAFIHAQELIHSSLSPRNVYLDESSNAYIDDLELSRLVQATKTPAELQLLMDEVFYTSVEQLQFRPLDFRAEVYSIGAIAYHMLTGVAPFSNGASDFDSVLQRKLRNQLIPLRQLKPELAPAVEQAVMRALRADPAERLPDLTALEKALMPAADSLLSRVKEAVGRLRPT